MPKVQVNDIEMYYEVHGSGEPLVMIMGWTANLNVWSPEMVEVLAEHFQVILFDNRGAGRSGSSQGGYLMSQFASDTIGLMDALKIEKAHVFGVSLGGMIAQEVALKYPERVNRLILGCTTCGPIYGKLFSPGLMEWFTKFALNPKMSGNQLLVNLTFSRDTRDMAVRHAIKAGFVAPITPENQKKQLHAAMRFNSYHRLKKLCHPTLVMTGDKDLLIPPKNSKILAQQIPNSKLVILKGMSHAFYADSPDKSFAAILKFLS